MPPLATLPPTPQSARPKSKLSLISSGSNAEVESEARASRPSAVLPLIETESPLPPVPLPKQVAFELVLTEVVAVASVFSLRILPPEPTTRRSAELFANAPAAIVRDMATTSAHAAASLTGMVLGI